MRNISILSASLALAWAAAAPAAELAMDHSGGVSYFRGTFANFGWTFTTTEARRVSALGVFDRGADGLADQHQVGIWNANGDLVVSATVKDQPLVMSSSAAGDWRFAAVSLTLLAPGTYTVGAYYPTNQDGFIGSSAANKAVLSSASWLTFGEGRVTVGGTEFFTRPDTAVSDQFNPAFFGPNFMSQAVPEPASWAMMIAGFGLAGTAARRHARRTIRHARA